MPVLSSQLNCPNSSAGLQPAMEQRELLERSRSIGAVILLAPLCLPGPGKRWRTIRRAGVQPFSRDI
jgi:hypothetical protein